MPNSSVPVFIPDLRRAVQIPEKGIVSHILQNDERLKVVLYGFAAGHEMSLRAAPAPTILYFVEREATLTLGDETIAVRTGAFTHIPSHLKHAIFGRYARACIADSYEVATAGWWCGRGRRGPRAVKVRSGIDSCCEIPSPPEKRHPGRTGPRRA